MKHCIAALFIILIFEGCTKTQSHQNQITKIELSRTGGESDDGAIISIDSNLICNYYGRLDNSKSEHYYSGKITAAFWDTLNKRVEQTKFKSASLNSNSHVSDSEEFELIIHSKTGKNRFLRIWGRESDPVLEFMIWLNGAYKKAKLTKAADSIKFEAVIRNPPMPKLDHVLFLPPKP
ncbi:hypothetical protein [Mucilaginibacter jinjuensis]|uniref:Uncharacterized protein n=1 Tax=Mucilaginibacter jinjuensis TaxID=1176721 RepID=A0ABY7T8P0_9SPHI|nr:hypothetical protein [Mucilaginibacter jinjuensis]WCT12613.1 hypothetical protein PQO05_01545 [Mucilaginibacter jinjuensis]